mmetsp:Transcript_10261/g.30472  ORF Transcript_10261/g.30472 Transcript_10261/m.30472 type:complete len:261 (+) Transcript_10261:673-1455(+)
MHVPGGQAVSAGGPPATRPAAEVALRAGDPATPQLVAAGPHRGPREGHRAPARAAAPEAGGAAGSRQDREHPRREERRPPDPGEGLLGRGRGRLGAQLRPRGSGDGHLAADVAVRRRLPLPEASPRLRPVCRLRHLEHVQRGEEQLGGLRRGAGGRLGAVSRRPDGHLGRGLRLSRAGPRRVRAARAHLPGGPQRRYRRGHIPQSHEGPAGVVARGHHQPCLREQGGPPAAARRGDAGLGRQGLHEDLPGPGGVSALSSW